jgi:tetratricopeptide (TPR) repeat protein
VTGGIIEQIKRLVLVVLISAVLSACGLMQRGLLNSSFWASSPFRVNDEAELGIANLAKGNFVAAEGNFQKALKKNPKDIHALLGAGILYQNTRQLTKAREMYEAVLAVRPDESVQFVVWNSITTRPASQIASVNLSLLDSGDVPVAFGEVSREPSNLSSLHSNPSGVHASPNASAMLERLPKTANKISNSVIPNLGANIKSATPIGTFIGDDASVISRFATIRALRDQSLLTNQEFNLRRNANIGALLPLTSPPPSAGLERPVPSTEQITGRLRAIGRALEMRAMSITQHAAERNMILDALMPSAPVVVANPKAPPQGIMEAADSVRRLEQLRDSGYIASEEYRKERKAIEMMMQPKQPDLSQGGVPSVTKLAEAKPISNYSSSSAIHLASFRTSKGAARGWSQIKRAHAKLVGGLDHKISKVNLGRKGTYFRLKVGPFNTSESAKSVCRELKRRRQFCKVTVMG